WKLASKKVRALASSSGGSIAAVRHSSRQSSTRPKSASVALGSSGASLGRVSRAHDLRKGGSAAATRSSDQPGSSENRLAVRVSRGVSAARVAAVSRDAAPAMAASSKRRARSGNGGSPTRGAPSDRRETITFGEAGRLARAPRLGARFTATPVLGAPSPMPDADLPRLPLAGITVLDFGQIYQGPYATLLMAKAGADVIKIEPPQGEPLRRRAAPGKFATLPFAMLNQNKRTVTLNLKHERGRALLFEMAKRADVLLENFSPGTMDDLGVGWSVLHPLNPRLIYATGSGFGITGPDRDNLAMDLTIQAASGIMSVTGAPDGPPMKAGPTVVDFMGGIHLYAAVMTALYERNISGQGTLCEIAMQETVYSSLAASMEYYHRTGKPPPRTGSRQAGRSSTPYNVYPASDGHVAIHVVTEGH